MMFRLTLISKSFDSLFDQLENSMQRLKLPEKVAGNKNGSTVIEMSRTLVPNYRPKYRKLFSKDEKSLYNHMIFLCFFLLDALPLIALS